MAELVQGLGGEGVGGGQAGVVEILAAEGGGVVGVGEEAGQGLQEGV